MSPSKLAVDFASGLRSSCVVLCCVLFTVLEAKETLQCRVATGIIVDASIPDSDLLAGG